MMMKTQAEQHHLRLRLTCLRPPVMDGATFGLQDREGTVNAGERHDDGAVSYVVSVLIVRRDEDAPVRFSGPCVHGTAAAPFLYLSLKRSAAHPEPWVRRLKVPLPALTWDEATSAAGRSTLIGCVSGAGSGTVAFDGGAWVWDIPA